MKIIAIIPARMGSSRFPGKPLAKINNIPMIEHCYKRSKLCDKLDACYVASCDQEIIDHIVMLEGDAVMTGSHHERATDRTAEALLEIEKSLQAQFNIIVMMQGDEPLVQSHMLSDIVEPFFNDEAVDVVCLMAPITTMEDFQSVNVVKVVTDQQGNALYFSRKAIPATLSPNLSTPINAYKQIGIMAFRRQALLNFNQLTSTPLEQMESVDMLRILEHGGCVRMVPVKEVMLGVDTPSDLLKVEALMAQ